MHKTSPSPGLTGRSFLGTTKKDAPVKPGQSDVSEVLKSRWLNHASPSAFSTWRTEAAVFSTISASSASVAL
jgi:hypothetical protein